MEFKAISKEEALEVAKGIQRKGTGARLFSELQASGLPSATVTFDSKDEYDKVAISLNNYLNNAKEKKSLSYKKVGEQADGKFLILLINVGHDDAADVLTATK